jgi:putative ABC transport system ATP-binding protein
LTEEKVIEVIDLVKIYRLDGVEIPALRGISFSVRKGEYVSIMGPSGSGKSTLMHLLGCLDKPTSGQVLIRGKNTADLSEVELARLRNKEIGFVFQSFNLLPRATALKNVELPLIYQGVSPKERRERATKALEAVGLGNRLHHFPSQLSGGQQQRVAISRALVTNPSIILADEPTGNLDTAAGNEVLRILKDLNRKGITIILVTHEEYVARQAGRIVKLLDGKVVGDELVEEANFYSGKDYFEKEENSLGSEPEEN